MSVFSIPKGVCKEIMDVIAQFWWGDDEEHRKMHWMAWWKLCISKSEGGMGFRNLYSFNLAMLAKQCWRLVTDPDSLVARVLKAKYYPNGSLKDTVFAGNASSTWHAIHHGLDLLKSVRIWRDPWLPRPHSYHVFTNRANCRLHRVSELLDD